MCPLNRVKSRLTAKHLTAKHVTAKHVCLRRHARRACGNSGVQPSQVKK